MDKRRRKKINFDKKKEIGTIWYIFGGTTKVEIVETNCTDEKGRLSSKCKILESGPRSKYKDIVGTNETAIIGNAILYPYRKDQLKDAIKNA